MIRFYKRDKLLEHGEISNLCQVHYEQAKPPNLKSCVRTFLSDKKVVTDIEYKKSTNITKKIWFYQNSC